MTFDELSLKIAKNSKVVHYPRVADGAAPSMICEVRGVLLGFFHVFLKLWFKVVTCVLCHETISIFISV